MRINIIGAGPAGLLFALLIKRRYPSWDVEVYEQNPPDATFGFGVVFSQGALAFLERDAAYLHRQLVNRMESWPIQRIVHRDERVDIDGNGFSAIGRLPLNQFLHELCRAIRVNMHYGYTVDSRAALPAGDLLVGADGVNSLVRRVFEKEFEPEIQWLTNRFAWYGTSRLFDCLTLTFRTNDDGVFVAHHYRHSPNLSTMIIECDEATWRRAGLDVQSDEESLAYCEGVFAADLSGQPLISNKSVWRQFPLISCRRWRRERVVLLGDALRTVHFSIGSGTRLAFEDAIALDRAFEGKKEDVNAALETFECERRPVVDKILAAAQASSTWYERMREKMELDPWALAYDYMTRSGRMTDERLRQLSPAFMDRIEKARQKH